jgi:hypothetical protein
MLQLRLGVEVQDLANRWETYGMHGIIITLCAHLLLAAAPAPENLQDLRPAGDVFGAEAHRASSGASQPQAAFAPAVGRGPRVQQWRMCGVQVVRSPIVQGLDESLVGHGDRRRD